MEISNKEITLKVSGEAGQGMQTIGAALCGIFKDRGLSIFANQDYMSRIRGGNNFFQIRISDTPLNALREKSDIAVALDAKSVPLLKAGLNDPGIIVLDKKTLAVSDTDGRFFDVPMSAMAKDNTGDEKAVNSVACGVLASMTAADFRFVEAEIRSALEKKGAETVEMNLRAAKAGYDFAAANFNRADFRMRDGSSKRPLLMNGNDAIALGAIRAGCKFYSAYPMTPSTSIMNTIAHYAGKFGIVVEQAEDEIAAINMVIGASFAGIRSMASTSGGGFALMVEGVSLAGMTETPIVVVEAQRPAPATGFPTRTEQADLDFVIHAGHGEFARAVFAPGTAEEAFYLTIRAFNIAEKYQIPVFILTDQYLADSSRDIETFDLSKEKVSRYIISREESKGIGDYKRYAFTDPGISPRAVPSWIDGVIYADSDEHTEEGHITEDAAIRVKMVEKRFHKKMAGLSREVIKPTAEGLDGADIVLVCFGSTYGPVKEACGKVRGKKAGFIHLSQVWPFPSDDMAALLKRAKKAYTVENNASGQLARLIRRETGIKTDGSILKFDGRPFDLDHLVRRAEEVK